MGKPSGKQVLVVFMVALIILVMRSEAKVTRNELHSRLLLREIGYTESKLEYHRQIFKQNSDRVSPGGPDPEHHSHPPRTKA
ncbi:hypothetical protein MANES_12G091100v8 [Manihot esculenta]|uniref:Uncharacterized protein n=1 Tax=Manihot esculenta TaxID=3983 RepID=A0A2C9UV50_MANES|nr:hypothetical protein MANES_12G091100v8 [Manihot esculenta]